MSVLRALLRDNIVAPTRRWSRLAHARALSRTDGARFECPVCGYRGIFVPAGGPLGPRKYGLCPGCGSFERHRLEAVVLREILSPFDPSRRAALHFSPEPGLAAILRGFFREYRTADLVDTGVDIVGDMRDLPIPDASFDFVLASAILEHIKEDRKAMAEIYRILKPRGMAVLNVPVVVEATIEYPGPVATEDGHVRAPGPDYFDRYREFFDAVKIYSSADFAPRHQLYVYEDRSKPSALAPLRSPMMGERHLEYVSICMKEPRDLMAVAAG